MKPFDQWAEELADSLREAQAPKAPKALCDTCNDTGQTLAMVCYGGRPVETLIYCPDCQTALAGQAVN